MKSLIRSVALLCLFVLPLDLSAQSSPGGVRGTVSDASGVVPGVSVTLINETTSARRSTVTSAVGEYVFAGVPAGTYTVAASLSGFRTFTSQSLQVGAQVITLDATLEIGTVSEEVVVIGSRRADRTVGNSTTPIDVFSGETLVRQGASNLNDVLRNEIVSFNVPKFVAQDGAAFIRPFTLRGLPPDQTLVLVNGKRRHRSALVQITNQPLASGAQGADIQAIPSIAVEQVEVLRDGAAAQYGSDAIAGVIDFRLKRAPRGFEVAVRGGQFYEGDGDDYQVQANGGLPLTSKGFLNVSGEYARSKPTSRGAQRPDAQALIDGGVQGVKVPAQRWGNIDTEAVKLFFNAEVPANDRVRVYSFGNFLRADGNSEFFYRSPVARQDIFRSVPLTTVPGGPRFTFASIYPGGFTPTFGTVIKDRSLDAGVAGSMGSGFRYDLSGGIGQSDLDYRISNTVNASFGPQSPTAFNLGTIQQREVRLNADFVSPVTTTVFAAPLNVAYGVEWRNEIFQIQPGEPASYEAGPFARVLDPDTGQRFGLAVGASGFPGYSDQTAGKFSRSNWAVYTDLETDLVPRLSVGVAARLEDFSDFGRTFNWKVSSRLEFSKRAAVRGSVNTGFRAPTPGQSNISEVATNIDPQTGGLLLVATLRPASPIPRFYGAKVLTPEESFNWGGGLVLNLLDGYTVTVDYFNIRVDDRIALTSRIPITAADRTAIVAGGADPGDFQSVRFLNNFFDSRTRGVDLVLTKNWAMGGSSLGFTAAANHTRNEVNNVRDARAVDRERRLEIREFNPQTRGHVNINYERGPWGGLASVNYYSKWTDAVPNAAPTPLSFDQRFPARWLVNLEGTRRFAEKLTIAIGAENAFDAYPDKDARLSQINNGIIYPQFSPFGFNGGFGYVRVTTKF